MSKDKVVSLGAKRDKKESQKVSHNEEREDNDLVYCSFCHRPNTQVLKMVQGPGVNI